MSSLAVSGLTKTYGAAKALSDVSLSFEPGEVHAIAGHNGAGKSTLIRIVSGSEHPDGGHISVDGRPVTFRVPTDAQRAGIVTIHQELSLIPRLSVAENIFLGDLTRAGKPIINWRRIQHEARQTLEWLGFNIDVTAQAASLPIAQQQGVELAKALHRNAKVVLLDEPTATLPQPDVARLIKVLKTLRDHGVAIIYVSHRMEEFEDFVDTVSVLRDGRLVETRKFHQTSPSEIIRAMIGRGLTNSVLGRSLESGEHPRLGTGRTGEPVLAVRELSDGAALKGVSFDLHRGEVLGVAGLIGSGQTELVRCLFGAQPLSGGSVQAGGQPIRLRSPRDAIRGGIGLVPQDRKHEGFVPGMSVTKNISMARLGAVSRMSVLNKDKEKRLTLDMARSVSMRTIDIDKTVSQLSGGNQQKVVVAKWLFSTAGILIFDEPTRGIDVGAKEEIYGLIGSFVAAGGSALLISSELSEVMMCDRVLVMARGRIAGEVDHKQIDAGGDAILDLYQ